MIHYLHDSIQNDTETETLMYTENIKKKIDGKNWHKYLDIIGWEKLSLGMIKFINRNTLKNYKNSPYGIIDCGGEGNC